MVKRLDNEIAAYSEIMRFLLLCQKKKKSTLCVTSRCVKRGRGRFKSLSGVDVSHQRKGVLLSAGSPSVSLEAVRRGFKTAHEVINTVWLMASGEGANMF